jgi:hypothetical protein
VEESAARPPRVSQPVSRRPLHQDAAATDAQDQDVAGRACAKRGGEHQWRASAADEIKAGKKEAVGRPDPRRPRPSCSCSIHLSVVGADSEAAAAERRGPTPLHPPRAPHGA